MSHRILVQVFVLLVLVFVGERTADAATTVVATPAELQAFLNGRTGRLVYVDNAENGRAYWIDLSDASVNPLNNDEGAREPLFSPDGTRITYGWTHPDNNKWPGSSSNNRGVVYIQAIGGGRDYVVGSDTDANNAAFSPHWWVDPGNGDEYIVYSDYYEKDTQSSSGRATWKQKVVNNQPSGGRIKILDHAFDGGLSKDGTSAGEAYHYLHMAKTMDLGGGDGWAISSRLDEGRQCCNSSMSPDNRYYIMHLMINHDRCQIRAWDDTLIQTIMLPSDMDEMQNPEFSTDPGFSTFTANKGSNWDIYVADTETAATLKVATGNFSVPHLWVAPAGPSLSLLPPSLFFAVDEGDGDPPAQTVDVDNLGADTLDDVTLGSTPSWLDVTILGSGNDQALSNQPRVSGLTVGTHEATVDLSCANAGNSPQSYSVSLTVAAPSVLTTIVVSPASVAIQPSESVELTAQARDQNGDPFSAVLDWSVSGGGSMAPTSSGSPVSQSTSTFTSDGTEGMYTVIASSGAIEGTGTVLVSVAPPLHLKVNCGDNGHDVADWDRDDPYVTGGEDWTNSGVVDTTDVDGAGPAGVYQSVRHYGSGSYPTFSFPDVEDGAYTVRLHFVDAHSGPRQINVDIEAARVLSAYDIVSDAGGTNLAVVKSFGVEVSDGDGLTIALGAEDGGDAFVAGLEVQFGADLMAPSISITSHQDQARVSGTVSLQGTAGDDQSVEKVEVQVDDGPFALASGTTSWSFDLDTTGLDDGTHTVTARAMDPSSNSATATRTLIVSNAAGPSIVLSAPNGGEVWEVGATEIIEWETTNLNDVTLKYSTDNGGSWQSIEMTVDQNHAGWGEYPWTIPDEPSTECLVLVVGYLGEAPTQSAVPFEIVETSEIPLVASCGCASRAGGPGAPMWIALVLASLAWRSRHSRLQRPF
ncbi:Ig-like domain-containing protein [Myxococcota bacterium]